MKADEKMFSMQDIVNAMWDLRRSLQMMDDSKSADLIMRGIYMAENKIMDLPPRRVIDADKAIEALQKRDPGCGVDAITVIESLIPKACGKKEKS